MATHPNPDLTGSFLIHNADPTDVAAARCYVEELARGLEIGDDSRSLQEIRADVLSNCCRANVSTSPNATAPGGPT